MNLALFDFDGTITYEDSFSNFVKRSVPKSRLTRGYLFLAPWIAGYRMGFVSGTQVRKKIISIGFKGDALEHVQKLGEAYARDVIPGLVREEALERIRWHKNQGDKIVVVSASLDLYLKPWCETYDLDLICSKLEVKEGRLTGKYLGGDCTAGEKRTRVEKAYDLKNYKKVYAYGDTNEDNELLAMADVRYFRWKEVSRGEQ
ncbi:MAG: HAD family hydrolase [Proteobacteria bacterium]|nr:MAG: HAD family hydrolase [Pseudomonadota bacterium]